jgi:hypothetical protein
MYEMTVDRLYFFIENGSLLVKSNMSGQQKIVANNVARLIDVVSTVTTDEIYTATFEDSNGKFSSKTIELMYGSFL